MKQSPKAKTQISTTHQLIQAIKTALDKLKTPHTVETGLGELKEIMQVHINSTTRMNILITVLSEQNEHMTLTHKKELAKAYGLMGETFGESLVAFFPKIFSSCEVRWEDPALHVASTDSLGVMVHHVFKQIESLEEQVAHLGNLIENLLEAVRQTKQNTQIGAAMCLTRVIQNGPPEAINRLLPQLADYLEDLLKVPNIKCAGQLLEILISLILSVELSFEPYVAKFLPSLLENMSPKQDWTIRKLAIDVIYTLAAFLPQTLEGEREHIISLLKEGKSDKSKHVREAAHEALLKLKESKEGKQLFETPPRVHKRTEEQKSSSEGYKSIFEDPVNPNFIKAAPKSPIEILTVGPLKEYNEEKKNENILDELKQEIEREEAEQQKEGSPVKDAEEEEDISEEQEVAEEAEKKVVESEPLIEVEDAPLLSQEEPQKSQTPPKEEPEPSEIPKEEPTKHPQEELAPIKPSKEEPVPTKPPKEVLAPSETESIKPQRKEPVPAKPDEEEQKLPLEQPSKPEPASTQIISLQLSVDKVQKVMLPFKNS